MAHRRAFFVTDQSKIKGISAKRIDRRLSVAPMMDWTDRHCRVFHRYLSPDALLFTEMVTAEAILHAGAERFCHHDEIEHPLALQLGGSNPDRLARAVEAVAPYQFDEINLKASSGSTYLIFSFKVKKSLNFKFFKFS